MKRILLALLLMSVAGGVAINATLVDSKEPPNTLVTKSGVRYEKKDDGWYIKSVAGGPDMRVRLNRIAVRVDASWTPAAITANGVAKPRHVGERLPGGYHAIDVPANANPIAYLQQLENVPGITWARFDPVGVYYSVPNDPYFPQQWGFQDNFTGLPSAWDLVTGDPSIKLGIIDSGTDGSHPDLPNIFRLHGSGDEVGHGTAVAGIAAARTNNGAGVAGVADGVSCYDWKLGASWGELDVANAITQMANNGVHVINLSLGFGDPNPNHFPIAVAAIDDAVDNHNMVIVAASGNGGGTTDFPASYSKVIAVSAVTENLDAFGQGKAVDVVAPGGSNITTTDVTGCHQCLDPPLCMDNIGGRDEGAYMCVDDDPYCDDCLAPPCPYCFGGTSAASPFVAGVAALMLSADNSLAWYEVRDILRATADKLPGMNGNEYTYDYGWGRVNAYAAVYEVLFGEEPPGPTVFHGTITSNTTWSGVYILDGDVMVAEHKRLTIDPGTIVYMELTDAADIEPFFEDRVELHVRGKLIVNGTESDPVQFLSVSSTPTETDWVHIQALGDGELDIDHAIVSHAEWGVAFASTGRLTITNSVFTENGARNVRIYGDPFSIDISDNELYVDAGKAVEMNTPASADIISNTIVGTENSTSGIEVVDGFANIDGNSIIELGTNRSMDGIKLFTSDADATVVTSNTISGCNNGIYASTGDVTIGSSGAGNDISDCNAGIYTTCPGVGECGASCATLLPNVRYNTIHENSIGVVSFKNIQIDLGTPGDPGNNVIENNDSLCVLNTASCGPVSAVGNYWGSCAAPTCTEGSVDVSGYLCSPPQAVVINLPDPPRANSQVRLLGNTPNPFNPVTTIHFELVGEAVAELTIFNVAGKQVRHVDLGRLPAGTNDWTWNGRDQRGNQVGSGVYFVQLSQGSQTDFRKIVMLK